MLTSASFELYLPLFTDSSALSPGEFPVVFDLRSFSKTLLYQASPSALQLQDNLKLIAQQDKQAEQKKKRYLTVAIAAIVLIFGILFLLPGLAVLAVVFVAVAIAAFALYARWSRIDLADVRYILPQRLAEMLSRDMAKDNSFEAYIDFSVPTLKQKQTAKRAYAARSGWTEVLFEDPWLRLSGRFLDDTEFALTLNELTVVRSGYKWSNGKRKYKSKSKPKGTEVQLLLHFPRKKYGAMSLLQPDLPQAVNLPPDVEIKRLKTNDHQLLLKVKVPSHRQSSDDLYQLVTQMLLSAYQGLNLSKELSKIT